MKEWIVVVDDVAKYRVYADTEVEAMQSVMVYEGVDLSDEDILVTVSTYQYVDVSQAIKI